MISQKWAKLIKSLHLKKFRKTEQLFFVEGEKAVLEVLASGWPVKALFGTSDFLDRFPDAAIAAELAHPCTASELEQVGTFTSNNAAVAVVELPHYAPFAEQDGDWVLVLDQVNDPGNLGTIIRIADWYGISHILCSTDTVDAFNPKVIASAKGSFLRVKLHYQPLPDILSKVRQPVFGAYLGGESVHQLQLNSSGGFIVLGNEANGISSELEPLISRRITIPAVGDAESLNVGIACAVIVDNMRRVSQTL
jgi:TrmH family RNA methyltransferase